MVDRALADWGRIDILVNNAGILRDKSFAKMSLDDFRQVVDVHLMGAVICTKAVWETMRAQNWGRIVMTTSSAGLYGNFGQANYGAAKMALVGLMNTLAIEGAKNNIRVNCLAPTAATQMLEGLLPAEQLELLKPEAVSPALLALVREDAPTKTILAAGAGGFEVAYVTLTEGASIGTGDDAAEQIIAQWDRIADRSQEHVPAEAFAQGRLELAKAGLKLEAEDVKRPERQSSSRLRGRRSAAPTAAPSTPPRRPRWPPIRSARRSNAPASIPPRSTTA
jgi:hypothetical protein